MKKTQLVIGLTTLMLLIIGSLSRPITTEAASSVDPTRSTMTASPTTVVANGIATTRITVNVIGNNGKPVSGKTVVIKANPSNGVTFISYASSNPGTPPGQFTLLASSTVAGTVTFSAVADGVTIKQTAIVTFVAPTPTPTPVPATPTPPPYIPPSASQSLVYSKPDTAPADSGTIATVNVVAVDGNGNQLAGRYVQVYIDPSVPANLAASVKIETQNAYTSATGWVVYQVRSSMAGVVTFRAIVDNTPLDGTASITFTDPAPTPTATMSTGLQQ